MTNRIEASGPALTEPLAPSTDHVLITLQTKLAEAERHRDNAKAVFDATQGDVDAYLALISFHMQRKKGQEESFGVTDLAARQESGDAQNTRPDSEGSGS